MHMLKTRSRVAFIDDDIKFLEGVMLYVSAAFAPTYHLRTTSLDTLLTQSAERLQEEQAQLLEITSAQASDQSAVQLALAFFADPQRFDTTTVLLADYAMPVEDGVSVCHRHGVLGLQRVLLTGIADDTRAIAAFNARSIEMFIPKKTPALLTALRDAMQAQMCESACRRGAVLGQALTASMRSLLHERQAAKALHELLTELGVIEFMVLGAPQGLVAVTEKGMALWIQLEDEASLPGLLEGLAELDWDTVETEQVKDRQAFVNLDFMTQLGQHPSCSKARVLSETPYLGAAVFELTTLPDALKPAVHSAWVAQHHRPGIEL